MCVLFYSKCVYAHVEAIPLHHIQVDVTCGSSQAGGQCTHSGVQESTGESRTRAKNKKGILKRGVENKKKEGQVTLDA